METKTFDETFQQIWEPNNRARIDHELEISAGIVKSVPAKYNDAQKSIYRARRRDLLKIHEEKNST